MEKKRSDSTSMGRAKNLLKKVATDKKQIEPRPRTERLLDQAHELGTRRNVSDGGCHR